MVKTSQKILRFAAGEFIFRQSDAPGNAYLINKGRVEVLVERPQKMDYSLGSFGPGSVIGESSIIDPQPRSASVRAIEDCEVSEISQEDFQNKLKSGDKTVLLVSQALIARYRDMQRRAEILGSNIDYPSIEDLELEYYDKSDILEDKKIADDFSRALREKEIHIRYQPIINVKSGEIAGFESLMRWQHPEKGSIPPGIFIPIVENAGLLNDASLWALEEACTALADMKGKVGYDKNLFMSVNISSTDLEEEKFMDSVYEIISKTDINPSNLKLEITERVLISQPEKAHKILSDCNKAGIDIVIDDFGTGYSSLTYLNAFPVNTIKIDRSFVRKVLSEPKAKKLIKGITSMAEIMEFNVIAEAVEDLEEAAILRNLGCEMIQGYFYAKPLKKEELVQLIRGWQPVRLID